MPSDLRKMRKAEKLRFKELRKDRLVQTRVNRRLDTAIREEARRRRMSVSNLVRGVLEDAFGLADPDVDPVLEGGLGVALENPALEHIYAWNAVVLGKDARCSRCTASMSSGDSAFIGLSEDAEAARAWLCGECGEDL
ncbi:MAG: hypothetical protein KUG77_23375 [Nannocystaceae bacterium]|nr:hypothetical protein [Nannocystaceae bacterium]